MPDPMFFEEADELLEVWRPSNSADGDAFIAANCTGCANWNGGFCDVVQRAMAEGTDRWRRDPDGYAICLSWSDVARQPRCARTPDLFEGDGWQRTFTPEEIKALGRAGRSRGAT